MIQWVKVPEGASGSSMDQGHIRQARGLRLIFGDRSLPSQVFSLGTVLNPRSTLIGVFIGCHVFQILLS